jgi:hypothetical protein
MLNSNTVAMVKTSNQLQQDTTVNTVLKTNDYSMFKTKKGNRELNQLHLKRLMQSVKDLDLLKSNPILVNEGYEIIDGQHRFAVCQELKKPVYYILVKGLGLREIQVLNANTKNWKSEDYIDGYCSMGMQEYCYLKNLLSTTKLGVTHLLALFTSGQGGGSIMETLRNGNLKLPYKSRGITVLQWIKDWQKYYPGADRRTFAIALVLIYNIKGYSHDKMMQKIKYQSTKLVDCTNTKTYLALLEEIYNYKERGEKLRFF